MRGVKSANFQLRLFTFSRPRSQVQDQDFINVATDNDDPTRFTGPNALDRKHQISFGGTFDLPFVRQVQHYRTFLQPKGAEPATS